MPSGGYPMYVEDRECITAAFNDEIVKRYGMQMDWLVAYVGARAAGALPHEAAFAAYVEWDL